MSEEPREHISYVIQRQGSMLGVWAHLSSHINNAEAVDAARRWRIQYPDLPLRIVRVTKRTTITVLQEVS